MGVAPYFSYWGKARPVGDGPPLHLLPFHGLDVAASGVALLEQREQLWSDLADFLDVDREGLLCWIAFLLSIHDLGKFANGFQWLRPDLVETLGGASREAPYNVRHDTLGHVAGLGSASAPGIVLSAIAREAAHPDLAVLRDVIEPWLAAVAGHHGRPPLAVSSALLRYQHFPAIVLGAAEAYTRDALALHLPFGIPAPVLDEGRLLAFKRASWLVAGLAVAADWIGSNVAWFPYEAAALPLDEYWSLRALPRAREAVRESGLGLASPSASEGLRALFPFVRELTPLQDLAERIPIGDGPQLFLIEEVTGGGKTEAAIALCHRLLANGSADGFYFGLPTMATANAMHDRLSPVYRRLFEEGSSPSWVLAHSAAAMRLPLEDRNLHEALAPGDGLTASRQCSAWLSDSRKKALLAHAGVGTIDQALLSVLPARHQSMRLFGLSRKVLVVDEVHACDAYMHRLLTTLLGFHASLGGSAVLLSATLPQKMRRELVEAFADGLGIEPLTPVRDDYPLVTRLALEGLEEHPVSARPASRRRVTVRPLLDEDTVVEHLSSVLDAGRCACWIRNSVDDAIDAYREWAARLGPDRVTLFHARFALCDRLQREQEVLARFGPNSDAVVRAGRLLIATQVVEQSLDLDFDAMVTDLAPIDLVIQRAGRLMRHSRTQDGSRTDGRDGRGAPILGVAMPDPVADAPPAWYATRFPRGAHVYEHHGQLWLSARWLQRNGAFTVPDDARDMIESVFAPESQADVPAGLAKRSEAADGRARAAASLARLNGLPRDGGYTATGTPWQDDASAPTRLGDPTSTVRLARQVDGRIVPFARDDTRHAWQLSQLTVRRSRIAGEVPPVSEVELRDVKATMPDRGEDSILVVLRGDGETWTGSALDSDQEQVRLRYDSLVGLQYGGEDADEPR
ncbi:MAG: CRISPR-associated helicase Cas3' [Thermoanaerobaculia bacterium]